MEISLAESPRLQIVVIVRVIIVHVLLYLNETFCKCALGVLANSNAKVTKIN